MLFPGMRLTENCVLTLKNKSHSITANITVPESGAAGVIATQGGKVGGWSLYAHEGRLKYCYNFFDIEYYFVTADDTIPAGAHQVRMEFKYDGGGLGKGGEVPVLRRQSRRHRPGGTDRADGVLLRRGLRRRVRHRLADLTGLRPPRQQILRLDRLGNARRRGGGTRII